MRFQDFIYLAWINFDNIFFFIKKHTFYSVIDWYPCENSNVKSFIPTTMWCPNTVFTSGLDATVVKKKKKEHFFIIKWRESAEYKSNHKD